jgi:DNA-binding NtrC family response regulator
MNVIPLPNMKGRRILFYDPDPKVRRVAERALIATGSDVEVVGDEGALAAQIEEDGYDLLMLNFDPPLSKDPKWSEILDKMASRFPRTRLVLHATAQSEDYLPVLAERPFVRNLIAKIDEPLEPDELIVTAEKLLRNDLFGLD